MEEFIAQEKQRLGRANDGIYSGSADNNSCADLKTPLKPLNLQSNENSPFKHTVVGENSPRLLPQIRTESKTSPLPSSRRGSKEEINTQGRFPPLLSRPQSGSSINSRHNSSGQLHSLSVDGNSGEKGLDGSSSSSSSMDIVVESPSKLGKYCSA